jgi:hypothetical protein
MNLTKERIRSCLVLSLAPRRFWIGRDHALLARGVAEHVQQCWWSRIRLELKLFIMLDIFNDNYTNYYNFCFPDLYNKIKYYNITAPQHDSWANVIS